MRIACPFCGERDAQEFAYLGDASLQNRPQTAPGPLDASAQDVWHDYVYLRGNPAGEHSELWYHGSGCRQWLTVTRHMRTHEITAVTATRSANARGVA